MMIRLFLGLLFFFTVCSQYCIAQRPNVILIMMDDVGYGDLSCHGNPVIKTPNIDRLYSESVRLINYHSGTTCSPTRASLLTGRHYNKLGVWHTIIGRSLLRTDVTTLPEVLSENGYSTGIFGKWHLGDNYPMRPQDQGFQYSLIHGGGGVGQTPDYWGNDYFDDTYFKNGKPLSFKGYCTDVWFNEALKYIENKATSKQPFFCYLPLNAAHEPHRAPQKNIDKFRNDTTVVDPVYNAMIDNIDENMGRLLAKLDALGLAENTILMFTSDNGTSNRAGVLIDKNGFVTKGFNAGMRGVKGQPFEGGHRVPFFIRFPKGKLLMNKDVSQLSSCMDIFPTVLRLCQINTTANNVEGENLLPYLQGAATDTGKVYIADTQRDRYLKKYKSFCVMKGEWRLVGDELFNIKNDPGQKMNVVNEHPDVSAQLKSSYEEWWREVEKENSRHPFVRIPVVQKGITALNCMDVFPGEDKHTAWNQEMIKKENNVSSGSWKLYNEQEGLYRIRIQQLPEEAKPDQWPESVPEGKAYIKINGIGVAMSNNRKKKKATFHIRLPKGDIDLGAGFIDKEGKTVAAQFAYIEKLN